ncbi:MAG: amino acid adenylation domain-containing protein [candidate division KSB1 bacterium]|nr:amino acid adenylation domain-containing protein [candidate division KSB1 bacterium]
MDKKNVVDFYPLTPMQQGMWFHTLLAPESGVYFEQLSCAITGQIDLEAFRRAWDAVIQRHPILRTSFIGESLKEPIQVVHRHVSMPFEYLDWSGLSPERQAQQLDAFLEVDRKRGFKLSEPPLMRCAMIRFGADRHQLVWSYHHILMDGWSLPLVLGEVFAHYDRFSRGQQLQLPQRRPFRDYIVWLKNQDQSRAEAFWRKTLEGFTTPTPLFPIQPTTKGSAEDARNEEIYLTESLTAQLQNFARKHQLTLNTVVQAAWGLVLGRYHQTDDVVFGATVSGRPPDLSGAEDMIGLFINTLPVRIRISDQETLIPWLKQLQQQQLEGRQYEYSSLIQIHQWSEVPRGVPLFETILVFENYPIDNRLTQQLGLQLTIENVRSEERTNYPINLIVGPGSQILLRILYDPGHADPELIQAVLKQLEHVLEQFVRNFDQRPSQIDILTAKDKNKLLIQFNATAADYPDQHGIHHLVEASVERSPESIAAIFEDQQLSYRELDNRANQLARYLKQFDIGPETVVAISIERSLDIPIAILGTLKSGAAYLPIDPDYPKVRRAYMLHDSGARLLITQQKLAPLFSDAAIPIIMIDADWPVIAQQSRQRIDVAIDADNLAYLIYTSGSTGQPKGTLLQHRGLCNYINANIQQLGISPSDRMLQFSSLSFDASVMELFTALVSGATLVFAGHELLLSGDQLLEFIETAGITVTLLPPSLLAVLSERALPMLKTLLTGGERCTPAIVQKWAPHRNFFNAYGPTEATVGPTIYRVESGEAVQVTVPIGRPLANTEIYLLDRELRPVPLGVAGELYIGGICLARGYHHQPGLTAEKFIPHPFSAKPGQRLYRTGDLARYRSDGNLEFLGRIDHQVKIHGFRIELEEIESVLAQHPAIRETVVIAHESQVADGEKRLVAYFISSEERSAPVAELRNFLKERLPDFMIPSIFIKLSAFPLLPNGKIDRQALPKPDNDRPNMDKDYVAPRDAWEFGLVRIWEEVLNVRPIGVTDNFFELGGHSLLAVRLIGQIQQRLGRGLPLNALFQEPTVENLARILRLGDGTSSHPTLVPLQPRGSRKPLFFVHPSGGSVHWYVALANYIGPDQPLYGVQAKGLNAGEEIHTSIEEMASYYVNAIRSVQPHGPYHLGSWSLGVIIAFEMAQQLTAQGESVAFLGLVDQGPFPPNSAPIDEASYLVELFGKHLPLSAETLRELAPVDQIQHVYELAIQTHWIRSDISLEQFSHFVRIMRTYNDAWRNYHARPYPGKITVFRATNSHLDNLVAPDLGWAELAKGGVEVHDVPGDHISMMVEEEQVRVLAQRISTCLAKINPSNHER